MKAARVSQRLARSATVARSYSTVHDLPHASSSFAQPPTAPTPTEGASVFQRAINATAPRNDWTKEQISEIHQIPLMELAFAAVCFSSEFGDPPRRVKYTHQSVRAHCIEGFINPPLSNYVPS
jgi:biotin synthase